MSKFSLRRVRPEAGLALLLTIPALLPLTGPGYYWNAHDARHSVFFLVEYDQAVQAGAHWPVWAPDQAVGFGYPLWLVYAPLAYVVGEALHLAGLSFTSAAKVIWALGFVIGAAGMYRLARRWWGPAAGLLASALFTYAPYHLLDIYVRAALAEFVALGWFPWALLAFANLREAPTARRAGLAALALGTLMLLHTVSTVIFGPVLAAFLLAMWLRDWRAARRFPARQVGWSAAAGSLGVALAMVFLLPMLLERRYLVESQWVHASYDYSQHFVYPFQLLSPFWGYGYAVAGPSDQLSLQLGLLPFVGGALGALALLAQRCGQGQRLPHRGEGLLLLALTLAALFAMTAASEPLWHTIPLLGLVQFPWRWLSVTAVTLALLAGAGTRWLESGEEASAEGRAPGKSSAYVYVAALAIVLSGFPYTRPELLPTQPDAERPVAVIDFELQYPDMRGMMAWSQRVPLNEDSPLIAQYLAGQPLQRAAVASGPAAILAQGADGASAFAVVQADGPAQVRFYTYYFPGWGATLDGQPAEIRIEPPNGLIAVAVPPGRHEVRVRMGTTPVRQAGAASTLAALVVVAGMLAVWPRKRAQS